MAGKLKQNIFDYVVNLPYLEYVARVMSLPPVVSQEGLRLDLFTDSGTTPQCCGICGQLRISEEPTHMQCEWLSLGTLVKLEIRQ